MENKVEKRTISMGESKYIKIKSEELKNHFIDNYAKNDVIETEKYISSILKSEYSKDFDDKRKRAMLTSYFKYGPVNENYARDICPISATDNMEIRLKKWKETKNKDYLIDIANFAMLAFMFESGVYDPKDDEHILDGVPINEIKNFDK